MLLMLNRLINITLNFWCQSSCVNGITNKFTLSAYLLKSNCLVDQANDIKKQFPIPDFLQSCTKTLNYREKKKLLDTFASTLNPSSILLFICRQCARLEEHPIAHVARSSWMSYHVSSFLFCFA